MRKEGLTTSAIHTDDVFIKLTQTAEGRSDPYPLYQQLHEYAPPIFQVANTRYFVVHRYEQCNEVLRDARLGVGVRTGANPAPNSPGRRYIGQLGVETNHHYNLADASHWDGVKGYEYQLEQARNGLIGSTELHVVGTPEQCIQRVRALRETTGSREIVGLFHFGGTTIETAEKSMRLFAKKVLPAVHEMDTSLKEKASA